MSHTKQASKRKRSRKAVPALSAAGLALSLAGGASAAVGVPTTDTPARQTETSQQIALAEEEVCDVSLGTYYVFDKEHGEAARPRVRFAMAAGGCGCSGCSGCGGCWTGTYYENSVFGNGAAPPHHPGKPAQKSARSPKHKKAAKNP